MTIYGRHAYTWGIFWSFLSAFLWSTTFIGTRYLLGKGAIDPLSLSFIRFLVAGIVLFAVGLIICRQKLLALNRQDIVSLLFLSLTGITGMGICLFWGLSYTTATNGSMILATSPIIIFVLSLFIGETVTRAKTLGLVLCIIGCFLVINVITTKGMHYDSSSIKGDGLVLLSAFCWAIYSVFGKKTVQKLGGYVTTTWVVILGAVEQLILIQLIDQPMTLPAQSVDWLMVCYIAIFPSAIAFFAFYEALHLIDLSLLNMMQYLTPVFTIILAFMLLQEKVTLLNLFGVVLVIAGVILTSGQLPVSLSRRIKKC